MVIKITLKFKKFLFILFSVKNIKTVFIFRATQMHITFHAVHEYFAVAPQEFTSHLLVQTSRKMSKFIQVNIFWGNWDRSLCCSFLFHTFKFHRIKRWPLFLKISLLLFMSKKAI